MTHAAGLASLGTHEPPRVSAASRASLRMLAALGIFASVTVLVGVVAVSLIPDQLNPGDADRALAQMSAHHQAEVVAGWMFAVGLAAVVPFIWQVVRTLEEPGRMPAAVGACIITIGATVNVAGGMIMVALGHAVAPWTDNPMNKAIATMLLHLGASLDSMYNLALGAGLLLIGRSIRKGGAWPRWLANVALTVGILSLPVALEWYTPYAAAVQYASGTLFLVWAAGMSVVAWRRAA